MGCDIHVMVEVRRQYGNNPADQKSTGWKNADNWRFNIWHGVFEDEPEMEVKDIFKDRDYELYGFLAGVRNYGHNPSFGFDRGFPEDADGPTRSEFESWGEDAHTPGFCTLAELKEKVATVKAVHRSGFVTREAARRHRETGEEPHEWCQGVGGPFADRFEWYEWDAEPHCFDRLLAAIEERKRDVFWIFNPADDDGSRDGDIRIVFWFDN